MPDDDDQVLPPHEDDDYLPENLFPAVPAPPRVAPPELILMLSGISDPQDRQRIIDTWHEATEGLDGDLLAQFGAMFAAVLRAYEARATKLYTAQHTLVQSTHDLLAEVQEAQEANATGNPAPKHPLTTRGGEAEFSAGLAQIEAIRQAVSNEVDRAVTAARSINARVLKIAIIAAFLAGMVAMAILLRVL